MAAKLLLVEDEALIAMSEEQMLQQHGFEVITAYKAETALEIVERDREIALILMDIDLGEGMDGTEAAQKIIESHDIPIVFLSSHTEPEIVEKTEGISSYGYIVKNSGETVLLASIKMAFRLHAAYQEIKQREQSQKEEKEILQATLKLNEERKRIDDERNKQLIDLYAKMELPQKDLLDFVLQASLKITDSEYGFTGLLDESESVMTIHRWSTHAMSECAVLDQPIHFSIAESGLWGDCIRERKPVIINDYSTSKKPSIHGTPEGHVPIERFLGIPVFDQGRVVAVGAVANKKLPYEAADADAITYIYDKMWSLLQQREKDEQIIENEQKFSKAFHSGGVLMTISRVDDGRYEDINEAFINHTGYSRDETIGVTSIELGFISAEDRNTIKQAIVEKGYIEDLELKLTKRNGDSIYCLYNGVVIEVSGKEKLLSIAHDITSWKKSQEALQKAKASFLDKISDLAYEADTHGNVLYVNKAAEKITGIPISELIGRPFAPLFIEEDRESLLDVYKRTLQGESLENILTFRNGKICHFTSLPNLDAEGNIVGTFGIARDITHQRRTEEQLTINLERYRKGQRLGKVGNWEYNLQTAEFWGSEEAKRIYGFDPHSDTFSTDEVESCIPERQRVHQALIDLIEQGKEYNIEFDIITNDTQQRKTIVSVAQLEHDAHGAPWKVTGVVQDISTFKQTQTELQKSVQLNTTLMQELNHRVKNNLQLISSLIDMKSAEAQIDLSDIRNQLHAIQLSHEKLRSSDNISEVDFKEYIQDLLKRIFTPSATPTVKVETTIEVDTLKTKQAIPLGLIINEIATNAIKHAFGGAYKGVFHLEMKPSRTHSEYVLTLSNNGPAFPAEKSLDNPDTLGLRLISALVEQIEGTITLQKEPHTVFEIRIPY